MPGYLSDFQKMFRAERYNTRFPLQKGDFVYTVFFSRLKSLGKVGVALDPVFMHGEGLEEQQTDF